MFVHVVNEHEDTDCNNLPVPFYKFEDVTDSFNPGRRFAFITMATNSCLSHQRFGWN